MAAALMNGAASYPFYDCFGMKISLLTGDDLLNLYASHVERGRQCVTAYQNMHGLHVRRHDPALDRLHRLPNTIVYIDGMPIVFLCRMAGIPAARSHRVTFVDFIGTLLTHAERAGWRIFYLGASERVLRAGIDRIRGTYPGLHVLGHSGFFDASDPDENRSVLDEIAAFRPHLVIVGMGMGRQERWILDNLAELEPACVLGVGALIEYLAGAVPVPPRWMGRAGLEWLFRLASDPKRFWFRYLVEPWGVAATLVAWAANRQTLARASSSDSQITGDVARSGGPR